MRQAGARPTLLHQKGEGKERKQKERKGNEAKGKERKGKGREREGKREGKGREGKGREGKGREGRLVLSTGVVPAPHRMVVAICLVMKITWSTHLL